MGLVAFNQNFQCGTVVFSLKNSKRRLPDEGQDGDPNSFLIVSCVEFVLSNIPANNNKHKTYPRLVLVRVKGKSHSMSSLNSSRAVLSCCMYLVIESKYMSADWMSVVPFSLSNALFRIT